VDAIDAIVQQVDQFPTLPEVALRALRQLDSEETTLDAITDTISLDQRLAGRIMKLANSPVFGATRPAESLKPAIFRLGMREVRTAVMTVAVINAIPKLPYPHALRTFWTRALASAMTARRLAEDLGYENPEEAYLAALVHLIGEVFLALQFTQRYEEAIATSVADDLPFEAAVVEKFGCDHATVGARVLLEWNFPPAIIEAVRCQFRPGRADAHILLASLVFVSDRMCRDLGLGSEVPKEPGTWVKSIPEVFQKRLESSRYPDFEHYMAEMRERLGEIEEFARAIFSES
jgi:HD-like signal output (HDOD) protein